MAILKLNLDEIKEPTIAPTGTYDLQITAAEIVQSRNTGNPMIKVTLGFLDGDYFNITHFLNLPTETDARDKLQFKALMLKRFLKLFGIPSSPEGIDPEQLVVDMPGSVAKVDIEQRALPRREGDNRDTDVMVNQLIIPRIRE